MSKVANITKQTLPASAVYQYRITATYRGWEYGIMVPHANTSRPFIGTRTEVGTGRTLNFKTLSRVIKEEIYNETLIKL